MADQTERKLAQSIEIGTLCAWYGALLTEKQLEALRLHFDEDYSLGEIAEELGVSRQCVHELIARSTLKLQRYEETLHLARQAEENTKTLQSALALIGEAKTALAAPPKWEAPPAAQVAAEKLGAAEAALGTLRKDMDGEDGEHGV